MISLLHLNKLKEIAIFFIILTFSSAFAATPENIWEKKKNQSEQNNQISDEKEITIESPILAENVNKITILGLVTFLLSSLFISFFSGNLKVIGIIIGPLWVFFDYKINVFEFYFCFYRKYTS